MPDLKVDLDALRTVGSDLSRVSREFEGANVQSDAIADATGHGGLAEVVRSFAHSWDDTRSDMIEAIRGMGEASAAIADAFAQTDGDLAAALTTPAPMVTGTPTNPGMR